MTLEDYETKIGDISVEALAQCGEERLDRVLGLLGPAIRHIDRVVAGQLTLVPGVEREIAAAIGRAERYLAP